MNSPVEVISVDRGVKTCQVNGCKTDASFKVIDTVCRKVLDGLEVMKVATYYCKKHLPKNVDK